MAMTPGLREEVFESLQNAVENDFEDELMSMSPLEAAYDLLEKTAFVSLPRLDEQDDYDRAAQEIMAYVVEWSQGR